MSKCTLFEIDKMLSRKVVYSNMLLIFIIASFIFFPVALRILLDFLLSLNKNVFFFHSFIRVQMRNLRCSINVKLTTLSQQEQSMSRGGRCLCFSKEKRNFICSKMFKNTHKTFQPSLLTRFNAQEFFLSVSFFFYCYPLYPQTYMCCSMHEMILFLNAFLSL